jgi:hypothetical protein
MFSMNANDKFFSVPSKLDKFLWLIETEQYLFTLKLEVAYIKLISQEKFS